MSQEIIFLLFLLLLGVFGKNDSIVISVIILLVIRFSGLGNNIFPVLDKQGIKVGIIIITVAVLTPIATGQISLLDMYHSLMSSYGLIALFAGILVAIFGAYGVQLLDQSPQVTISLVVGTILGVVFLKGVPVGPLIGAGIAMSIIRILELVNILNKS
ncbi:hypothetical protein BHF71_06440 [Vulcanibacillus modesticaldus]|uniref:UPF0756 membrane protein BHF71_06440 n=1 Tax=Vulcanibacillus modesticaldus TaxID=337097 RepID=A0A1D2YWH6_9BACI|nr:hypothetical protein BHF71_06440 [Vulcanibacillus modesticaldus]